MMANTHVAFGLLFGLLALSFLHPANSYVFLGIAVFASLLPDLDHASSLINNRLKLFRPLSYLFRHRGILHTVWIPAILWLILWAGFGSLYGSAVFIGYFAHLFSDGLTKAGINMVHPIRQLRMQGFIETGGLFEIIIFLLVTALDVVLLVKLI